MPQSTGFEPVRAEPNGFRVHRLNHSATTARDTTKAQDEGKIISIIATDKPNNTQMPELVSPLKFLNFFLVLWFYGQYVLFRPACLMRKYKNDSRPRRDSNSQSSDPKSDALSIRPRGRHFIWLEALK